MTKGRWAGKTTEARLAMRVDGDIRTRIEFVVETLSDRGIKASLSDVINAALSRSLNECSIESFAEIIKGTKDRRREVAARNCRLKKRNNEGKWVQDETPKTRLVG
jgi:hypothetical protein